MPERDSQRRSLNWWGIANAVLLIGGEAVWYYGFQSNGFHFLNSGCGLCVILQSAAAVCGIIAVRRGSWWWMLTVLPSGWLAFGCFLCDL